MRYGAQKREISLSIRHMSEQAHVKFSAATVPGLTPTCFALQTETQDGIFLTGSRQLQQSPRKLVRTTHQCFELRSPAFASLTFQLQLLRILVVTGIIFLYLP